MGATVFEINIGGVNFNISRLVPKGESDRVWIVVHPKKDRPKPPGTMEYLDGNTGTLPGRPSPVAVGAETNPDGGLNEQQTETARNLAHHLADHYGSTPFLATQLHEPGSESSPFSETLPFEESKSTKIWISVPRRPGTANSVVQEELKIKVGKYLFEVKENPRLLSEEQPEKKVTGPHTAKVVPQKHTPPTPISTMFETIAGIVDDKAPNCPPGEKTALIAAIAAYAAALIEPKTEQQKPATGLGG